MADLVTDSYTHTQWLLWTSLASSVTLATLHYIFNVAQRPKLYASNKKFKLFLSDHLPILKEKYYPTWYVWEGRLQSIMGLFLRISEAELLPYKREIVNLQDGGLIGIDTLEPPESQDHNGRRLIVFFLPGLTSDSQTSYVKSIAMAVVRSGATVCVMNHRGLGGVPLKTTRTYCATNFDDGREAMLHLKKKYPSDDLVAIGCSMGGMQLSQYLITHPEEAKENLVAALVLSVVWNALGAVENLEKPFINKYIVNTKLTQNLQGVVLRHEKMLQQNKIYDFEQIYGSKYLREFDSHFTSKQFGYPSALAYYDDGLITNRVNKFSIPVLGLSATDDPMQPGELLPTKEAEFEGSNLALLVTERGGHLGFLESTGIIPFRKPFHYMERLVMEWVSAVRLHPEDLKF